MRALLFSLALLAATPAMAETRLTLSDTGTASATPDDLQAMLAVVADGPARAGVQEAVNRQATQALAAIRAVPGVNVSTGAYNVWTATAANNPAARGPWHGQQNFILHGADGPAILDLVGRLQQMGLATQSLGWRLSPELQRTTQEAALRQAVLGLRGRAELMAGLLGLKFAAFATVSLEPRQGPMPVMRAMAAAPEAAAPVAVREDVTLSATVQAEAVLTP